MILEFPLDVWGLIIERGRLDIPDVLNLLRVNKQLNVLLKHNSIWYRIMYNKYLKLQLQFDIKSAKQLVRARNDGSTSQNYFQTCMWFYKKDLEYHNSIPDTNADIGMFLDRFSIDDDYLPIIYNHYHQLPQDYTEMIRKKNYRIHLSERADCLNLLQAQSFKVGIDYLSKMFNGEIDTTSASALEEFWFNISLLDRASHSLVYTRQQVLKRIFKLLHRDIRIKIFFNESIHSNVSLISVENDKDILVFKDEQALMQLIVHIFRLSMSCLEFQNPLVSIDDEVVFGKYCSSYFLEDFSLLRLYGGQVKGHPFLIMAILIKVIDEFLISNYRIRFEDSENIENLQINMTSTYLRVRNHLFSFDRKTLTLFTSFDVYTISEVVMNLRNRSYFEISKFIEPLEFKYVVECFLHLDTFMEAKSLDTIMRPDYYFTNPIVNLNSFVHHEFNTISAQAYSFLKLLCRYIQDIDSENDFLDSMFCRELERSMNYLNNHIYFNAIFHTLQNNPSKQNKVKAHFLDHPSEDWLFSENFALFEDNSKISIKKILKNYFFVKVRDPTKPLQSGTIIKHEKFETYGIVLGEVMTTNENTHYYRVYTTKKTTECYNLNSISVVDHNTKDLDKLLNFILKSCGEDVIASLFGNCLVLSESHPLLLMF